MFWPDLTFPPINLWSYPVQTITYDFKGYPVDQDPSIQAMRGQSVIDYMDKLKWLADNSMEAIFVSELVIEKSRR